MVTFQFLDTQTGNYNPEWLSLFFDYFKALLSGEFLVDKGDEGHVLLMVDKPNLDRLIHLLQILSNPAQNNSEMGLSERLRSADDLKSLAAYLGAQEHCLQAMESYFHEAQLFSLPAQNESAKTKAFDPIHKAFKRPYQDFIKEDFQRCLKKDIVYYYARQTDLTPQFVEKEMKALAGRLEVWKKQLDLCPPKKLDNIFYRQMRYSQFICDLEQLLWKAAVNRLSSEQIPEWRALLFSLQTISNKSERLGDLYEIAAGKITKDIFGSETQAIQAPDTGLSEREKWQCQMVLHQVGWKHVRAEIVQSYSTKILQQEFPEFGRELRAKLLESLYSYCPKQLFAKIVNGETKDSEFYTSEFEKIRDSNLFEKDKATIKSLLQHRRYSQFLLGAF